MSSRGLAKRIGRLERAPGAAHGPCRYCAGFGVFSLIDERKGQTRADAKGCPSCGKVSKLIILGD